MSVREQMWTSSRPADVELQLTDTANRFRLHVDVGDREHSFDIAGRPALDRATAWERCARRIDHVELCRCRGAWSAVAQVVGRRIPVRQPVSIGTALAFGLRGGRLVICPASLTDEGVGDGRLPL